MSTILARGNASTAAVPPLSFTFQTPDYRSVDVPGYRGMKLGTCFIRVTDLPDDLGKYMKVNPRCPSRNQKGVLTGPVIRGILDTLDQSPETMALKSQGVYLLTNSVESERIKDNNYKVVVSLTDVDRHGIVNGGHTFAAIRKAINESCDNQFADVGNAWVKLHLYQGVDREAVTDMAEGLNRSKQVDDPSLNNLGGLFDTIKAKMAGKTGEHAIAYHQGDDGDIYITEILAYLEMFNCERFNDRKHPQSLYQGINRATTIFANDYEKSQKFRDGDEGGSPALDMLVDKLPEILLLADTVRLMTRDAAKRCGFTFGRMKLDRHTRAASEKHHNTMLHFVGKSVDFRTPNGWLFPMLSAFRANVRWELESKRFEWKLPLNKLVGEVIDELVSVCVSEHRDNNVKPELVGKRESVYKQCYYVVERYLLQKGVA